MYKTIQQYGELRSVSLAAVRYLTDRGRLEQAAEIMGSIEQHRRGSDLMLFASRVVRVEYAKGSYAMFHPRTSLRRSWREFDTVQWDLAEAMGRD